MWKHKMKKFEEKNLQKANTAYRNLKRVEKQMAVEKQGPAASVTTKTTATSALGVKPSPA